MPTGSAPRVSFEDSPATEQQEMLVPGQLGGQPPRAGGPQRGNLSSATSTYGLNEPSGADPARGSKGPYKWIHNSGQMTAWKQFNLLDVDSSNTLNYEEVARLAHTLNVRMTDKEVTEAFAAMDHDKDGEVSFPEFSKWLTSVEETERRQARRMVREAFDRLDTDRSGTIGKKEFSKLMHNKSLRKRMHLMADAEGGEFDLETDWKRLHNETPEGSGVNKMGDPITDDLQVTFNEFELWWKDRNGIDDPDIPVLPEYMAKMANEICMDPKALLLQAKYRRAIEEGREPPKRTGRDMWDFLRPRLKTLVTMQSQWGDLREIYESHTTSFFANDPLPKYIRDPEGKFAAGWDVVQIFLLMYVSFTVPYRVCFGIDVEFGGGKFWFDNLVDLYFITDMCLNFRTAYYDDVRHTRIDNPREIARHYLKGWFIIDFVSCVPVQHIGYAVYALRGDNISDNRDSNLKVVKILRLARMSKMLRLARIKRILMKYQDSFANLMQYMSMYVLVFVIVFLSHMLSCFFYLVGDTSEDCNWVGHGTCTVNGTLHGWVYEQWGDDDQVAEVSVSTRYFTSMFYVFNALEPHFETGGEKGFAIFANLVMGIIYGSLAGVISTIMIGMKGNDQEVSNKLRSMRAWMGEKRVPKPLQARIMQYFNQLWSARSLLEVNTLLQEMPPTMSAEVSTFLYRDFLATIPLFRGLSEEILYRMCEKVVPMMALKMQTIIAEGQPGTEMYLLMSGEVEVSKDREILGFLSEGSFFGEIPVLAEAEPGSEIRTRTVKSVTESELCYLRRDDVKEMMAEYPELKARIQRFSMASSKRNSNPKNKLRRSQTLSRNELAKLSKLKVQVKQPIGQLAMLHEQDEGEEGQAASPDGALLDEQSAAKLEERLVATMGQNTQRLLQEQAAQHAQMDTKLDGLIAMLEARAADKATSIEPAPEPEAHLA